MTKKNPTNQDIELAIVEFREEFREEMKKLYAEKRVEILLYGMIGLILVGFMGALIAGVFK